MQSKTDTVRGGEGRGGEARGGEGVWTHDRNISNRYMLSTSDKEDGAAALKQKDFVLSPGQSLCCFRKLERSRGWWGMSFGAGQLEVAWRSLCTAYIYTGEEDGGSRGGGGVTRSREHYSDARGGLDRAH